ncbi:MAG: hypothetical protein K2X48_13665 [Chitinophagaceae bacterium]|nr:hypothetical protein [Chitinophagaceae bacterium]
MKKLFFSLGFLLVSVCIYATDAGKTLKTELPKKEKVAAESKSKTNSLENVKAVPITCCAAAQVSVGGFPVWCVSCASSCDGPNGANTLVADCLMDMKFINFILQM